MAMRIWHQSFTVLEDLPPYRQALETRAAEVLRPDTELVLHGQLPGTYPSEYPGDDIGFGYTYQIHGNQWIAAGRSAEDAGFDAYAMCTLPNPMLREVRSIVDIPVVGLGETACHLATMYGQRFGIILFIDRMIPLYQDQMRAYGLDARCAAIRASGLAFSDVLAGFTDPTEVIERFTAVARRMIAEDGADVIIPGEVPLNMLLSTNGITRIDDVPIVDSYAATLKTAELMVDLARVSGMTASRHGFYNSSPGRDRVDQVHDFYGLSNLPSHGD